MIGISATIPRMADIVRRAQKAEDRVISDVRRRAPGVVKKATRSVFPGLAAKDPGLTPKFKTAKLSGLRALFPSYGQRVASSKLIYTGRRHKLTVPGLGKVFSGKRKDGVGLTAYGRMWRSAQTPYRVGTPAQRGRVPFGTDKALLFVMAAKSKGAETGVPLLFRRDPEDDSIAPITSIASPQAVSAKRAARVWRPRLAALIAERLQHQWQRSQK